MSLTNPNTPVSQQDLQDFYHKLLPYMGGGSSGGGGHTIEDSEGTDLTQRDILQFGEGFLAEDDSTNEKTVISPDKMQSGDMSDVITPLPSVAPKKEGIKYSTTEQVIGEWIDEKPIYQKTVIIDSITGVVDNTFSTFTANIASLNVDSVVNINGILKTASGSWQEVNYRTTNAGLQIKLQVGISATSEVIQLVTNTASVNNSTCYVTLQYTKTTD